MDDEGPELDPLDPPDTLDRADVDGRDELEEMRRRRRTWVKPVAIAVAISMLTLAAPVLVWLVLRLLGS